MNEAQENELADMITDVAIDYANGHAVDFRIAAKAAVAFVLAADVQPPAAWQPIETAPAEGEFLVYMPDGDPKVQVGVWHPNVKVIGNHFRFDMWEPTHWAPLPATPQTNKEPQ